MTLALRTIALLIAVVALIDPAFTMAGRAPARVALVVQDAPTMELPLTTQRAVLVPDGGPDGAARRKSDGDSRRVVAEKVGAQLAKDLGDDYLVQPRLTSD